MIRNIFVLTALVIVLINFAQLAAFANEGINPKDFTMPQIAFASNSEGNFEICVMNADGTNIRNLTNHPAVDNDPDWSPDGKRIAFVSNRTTGERELHVLDLESGKVKSLNVLGEEPDWSPDGSKIAFVDGFPGWGGSISVVNSDGQDRRVVSPKNAGAPAWSPDGKSIAFDFVDSDSPILFNIGVVNVDGGNFRKLTEKLFPWSQEGYGYPAWSPDGKEIAFSVRVAGKRSSVNIMDSDGQNKRELVGSFAGTDFLSVESLSWSPSGDNIVFDAWSLPAAASRELFSVSVVSGEVINLSKTNIFDEWTGSWFDPLYVPPEPAFPWDVNKDGVVNIFDLVLIGSQFGQVGDNLAGDVNGDGRVNIFDLVVVGSHFGESSVAAAPAGVKTKLTAEQVTILRKLLEKLQTYDGDPLEGIEKAIANLKKIRDGYDPSRPVEPKNKRFTTWGAQKAVR